jgi:hypothetical protein
MIRTWTRDFRFGIGYVRGVGWTTCDTGFSFGVSTVWFEIWVMKPDIGGKKRTVRGLSPGTRNRGLGFQSELEI